MALNELNIIILLDTTGNQERAIDNLITDLKNHFRGRCGSEQYVTDQEAHNNYTYRVTEILTEEEYNGMMYRWKNASDEAKDI